MKIKPILFSTPMVQALLAGTKTQTRRVVKPAKYAELTEMAGEPVQIFDGDARAFDIKPPYATGDVLWVRETWSTGLRVPGVVFRADLNAGEPNGFDGCWKPSIFMPKAACRLFLKVKSVRVERLQDISEADAVAEGIEVFEKGYRVYTVKGGSTPSAIGSFSTLWEKINGLENLKANPWVWVVEFERCDKPENFI